MPHGPKGVAASEDKDRADIIFNQATAARVNIYKSNEVPQMRHRNGGSAASLELSKTDP